MKAAAVAAMIATLHPSMPAPTRFAYARILAVDPDPPTLVAIPEHEAGWRPHVIGGLDGQCIGLGQRCLRFDPACHGVDFTHGGDVLFSSLPACAARRAALLDGPTALRELVIEARAWRRYCRKVTRRPPTSRRWISGYAGFDGAGVVCGQRRARIGWRDVKPDKVILDIEAIKKRLLGGPRR